MSHGGDRVQVGCAVVKLPTCRVVSGDFKSRVINHIQDLVSLTVAELISDMNLVIFFIHFYSIFLIWLHFIFMWLGFVMPLSLFLPCYLV